LCNWSSLQLFNESDKTIVNKEKYGRISQFKVSFVKIKGYFIRRPGALFIIGFDALILTCAFLLVQGNSLVNDVAVYAYCLLVVGVVLQAIAFLKDKNQ